MASTLCCRSSYIGFAIGCFTGYALFAFFLRFELTPRKGRNFYSRDILAPKHVGVFFITVAQFTFGWAAGVLWVLPIATRIVYAVAAFNIVQSVFA